MFPQLSNKHSTTMTYRRTKPNRPLYLALLPAHCTPKITTSINQFSLWMLCDKALNNFLVLMLIEGACAIHQYAALLQLIEPIFDETALEVIQICKFEGIQEPLLKILGRPIICFHDLACIWVGMIIFKLLLLLLGQFLHLLVLLSASGLVEELEYVLQRPLVSAFSINKDTIELHLRPIFHPISLNHFNFITKLILFYQTPHYIGPIVVDLYSLDADIFIAVRHKHGFISRSAAQLQDASSLKQIKTLDRHGTRVVHSIECATFIQMRMIDFGIGVECPKVIINLNNLVYGDANILGNLFCGDICVGLNSNIPRYGDTQLIDIQPSSLHELIK